MSLLQPRTGEMPHSRRTVIALVHPQHGTLARQQEAMNNQHITTWKDIQHTMLSAKRSLSRGYRP